MSLFAPRGNLGDDSNSFILRVKYAYSRPPKSCMCSLVKMIEFQIEASANPNNISSWNMWDLFALGSAEVPPIQLMHCPALKLAYSPII